MNWAWISGGYTYDFSQTITGYDASTGTLTVYIYRNANGMPERQYVIYDVLIVKSVSGGGSKTEIADTSCGTYYENTTWTATCNVGDLVYFTSNANISAMTPTVSGLEQIASKQLNRLNHGSDEYGQIRIYRATSTSVSLYITGAQSISFIILMQ